ncbi:hypothetical protein BURKHO8Y_540021 [Burkholderia sp. 8Y]|nr:hypothetical protein BURKHO8Y_540021 [Burkholderia sp. 8Y]
MARRFTGSLCPLHYRPPPDTEPTYDRLAGYGFPRAMLPYPQSVALSLPPWPSSSA